MSAALVWFRQDLRLRDNPALTAAAKSGAPVVAVFIWSPQDEGAWPPGAASRWWLHHSLASLDAALRARKNRLILRAGSALEVLPRLARKLGANSVFWNRRYEPAALDVESRLEAQLGALGIHSQSFNSALLVEPSTIANGSGKPYRVFTAFKRRVLRDLVVPKPLPVPQLRAPPRWPRSASLSSLKLLPKIGWDAQFGAVWQPGEAGAQKALRRFIKHALVQYPQGRNLPAIEGTSRLSAYLHHGELGPRQIWHALGSARGRGSVFVSELVWREFAYHLLYHFPQTTQQPLRPEFVDFPWRDSNKGLRAWQRGRTGVPLVDAGMRELWAVGWMHNRVRMVVGSFLVKNLRIRWQSGARWFWDTLVDADLANNTLNWQWVAGCGADAAPYFRVFNPERQADRFDPQGAYTKHWAADSSSLARIVDLAESREAALEAYQRMRARKTGT